MWKPNNNAADANIDATSQETLVGENTAMGDGGRDRDREAISMDKLHNPI